MLVRAPLASALLLAGFFEGAAACGSHAGGGTGSSTSGGGSSVQSNECQSYCDKALLMGCLTSCDPGMVCQPRAGECNASAEARIACEVAQGIWTCTPGGGLQVKDNGCVANDALCPDGG